MKTTLVGCKGKLDIFTYTVIDEIGVLLLITDDFGIKMTIETSKFKGQVKWIPEEGQIWANTEAGTTLKIVSKTSQEGVYLCINTNNEERRLIPIQYLQENYVLLGFPVDTQEVPTLDIQESQTNLSEGDALLKFFATPTGQWKGYNND